MLPDPTDYLAGFHDWLRRRFFTLDSPDPSVSHYTTFAALNSIVSGDSLHASNVHFMNDPTELAYAQRLLTETAYDLRSTYRSQRRHFPAEYLEGYVMPTIHERGLRHFVISFSLDADSQYLWKYYGQNDGYALSVRLSALVPALERKVLRLKVRGAFDYDKYSLFYGRVVYDERQQRRLLRSVVGRLLELVTRQLQILADRKVDAQTVQSAIGEVTRILYACVYNTKSPPYAPEKEYRVVLMPDRGFGGVEHKTRGGQAVPFVQLGGAPLPYHELTIGPAIKDVAAERRLTELLTAASRPDVGIRRVPTS